MKYPQPQRPGESKARPEIHRQNCRTDALHAEAADKHRALQAHNALHIVQAQSLSHNHALLEAHAPPQQEHKQRCNGHKAQAAELNQAQQDPLAEAAPLGIGIKGGESRHTGGRSCRKEGRKERAALSRAGSNGQRQQHCS